MPIYNINNRKVLFIHIPKTAGTSIEFWLRSNGIEYYYEPSTPNFLKCPPQHLTYSNFELLNLVNDLDLVFAITRNPYERIESEFSYRCKLKKKKYAVLPNFSNWVINNLNNYNRNNFHLENHMRPQVDFLSEKVKVFKLENTLEKVFQQVSEELDISIPEKIPFMNKSKKFNPRWTIEAVRKVNDVYKNDFDAFDYPMKNISDLIKITSK